MIDTLDRAEAEGARAALAGTARNSNPYSDENHAFMWDVGWLERDHSEAFDRWPST